MSSEPLVLRAEGIGKRYRVGQREPYRALRDVLADAIRLPARAALGRGAKRTTPDWIWAIEDVSFDVRRGEVVGLIGANGAGKSTLLKLLSRITEPTSGRILIGGRVGSLLEVGTGFHPELTGRENIYLNGTILGMRKGEIDRRFEEIVAFSNLERFLDTPVKRYSSGMQVRLAFAVAAHLETQILLVDEVLAVGDAEFQQKCLGKMKDVTNEGRTIVFVSHNLAAVQSLCTRALVLDQGRLAFDGSTGGAVERYLGHGRRGTTGVVEGEELALRLAKTRVYADAPLFECNRISVLDERGLPTTTFRSDEEITVAIDYTAHRPVPSFRVLVTLTDAEQATILRTESIDDARLETVPRLEPGAYRSQVTFPRDLLGDALLDLNVSLISEVNQTLDYSGVATIEVRFAGLGLNTRGNAYLRPQLPWRTDVRSEVGSVVG
jgi:homopolymeric O-antigen transport system ATP-binding protein